MKIEAHQLPAYITNKSIKNAVNRYKDYCTIRRDLRNAYEICEYVIKVHCEVNDNKLSLDNLAPQVFLIRASVMHAIILYGRWFLETKGKTTLKANTFFKYGSVQMAVHKKLMDYRNKYIAHNELDILGADRVWINTDDNNKFVSSESDWLDQMWLQDKDLNMTSFKDCVIAVHNKIDDEILKKQQDHLDNLLKSLL